MCRSSNYTTFCKQNVSSADRFQHNPKVMRLLISSRHCPNKVFHRSSELLCPVKFMTISIPVLPLFRNPLRPQQFWAGKLFNVPNHAIIIPLGYMLYSKTRIIHSSFSPLIFFFALTFTECGVQTMGRPETRIVGGKNAPFGRWPWQVSVRRTSFFGFSSTHRCGGAVINDNWIATAGHCVDE